MLLLLFNNLNTEPGIEPEPTVIKRAGDGADRQYGNQRNEQEEIRKKILSEDEELLITIQAFLCL